MPRLQNKVAVIGASVSIFARPQEELDKTVASIGRNVAGVQGDVRKLDVVVANIGAVDSVRLADVTIESFDNNFDVNAPAVFTVQPRLAHSVARAKVR